MDFNEVETTISFDYIEITQIYQYFSVLLWVKILVKFQDFLEPQIAQISPI